MTEYRIVRGPRRVEIYDQYGRCVDQVLDPGGWQGVSASKPQPEPTDEHIVSLIEQGERSGSFTPHTFEEQRTYNSTTRQWSTRTWPERDA
jgi:hypothetical protein